MLRAILAGVTIVLSIGAAPANETIDPFARKWSPRNLSFPDPPRPASQDKPRPASQDLNMMLRPDGAGPFPALVIMPVCGANHVMNAFDWGMRAVQSGYVALVVDPLTQRLVVENCGPTPVGTARYL